MVQVLTTNDIVQALETNVDFEDKLFEGHRVAYCRNFDHFQSIHDLSPNGNEPSVFRKQLVDKYARRHARLLHTLNQTHEIKFVFHTNKTVIIDEILRFVNTVQEQFPHLRNLFHLYVITTHRAEQTEENIPVTIICLEDFPLPPNRCGT